MKEIKIKYNLSWIMTRAGELRRLGMSKSTALVAAWAEEKAKYDVTVAFPALNKNDWLSDNDKEIERKRNVEKCRIYKIVKLTKKEWNEITNSLLESRDSLWEQIGGCRIDDESLLDGLKKWSDEWVQVIREHAHIKVVKVECKGYDPIYVNTEGYSYARYVGRGDLTLTA
ncbi:hypothetical protein AMJ80_06620 [bacterium SM23_31]|nr:MAG: hypothetical protein AMJ80_06620 [bacterium SM23_31]